MTKTACYMTSLRNRTYIVFVLFKAAFIPCVWIFFLETSKRYLEQIVLGGRNNGLPSPSSHLYFAKAHSEGESPVKMARKIPRYHTAELDGELMKYLMLRMLVGARRCGVSLRLLLRLGRSRDVGVQESGRFWVLQESQDCSEERTVPWSKNALVCDCGGRLRVLLR